MFGKLTFKPKIKITVLNRFILLFLFAALLIGCSENNEKTSASSEGDIAIDSLETPSGEYDSFGFRVDTLEVEDYKVSRNESLYLMLNRFDFSQQEIQQITAEADEVLDGRSIRPGQNYRAYLSEDSEKDLERLVWQPNALEYVVFDWESDSLSIYKEEKEMKTIRRSASGLIQGSLYEAMVAQNLSPVLAYRLADIYAWQIDFFGLRQGDGFKIVYEENYIDDSFFNTGDILAVEFIHRGESYHAYRFEEDDVSGYYDEEGNSVQKALLKAPFEYNQRISSGFSKSRFHPVAKEPRPHNGVDYAAPHGTPVLSVGDGRITEAQHRGASGNIVKVQHNSNYGSAYLHLDRFAEGVYQGANVEQGQVIGFVGNTGTVTGTHLHFEVYKNGQPVNPLRLDLPADESIPDSLSKAYAEMKQKRDSLLEDLVDPSVLVDQAN